MESPTEMWNGACCPRSGNKLLFSDACSCRYASQQVISIVAYCFLIDSFLYSQAELSSLHRYRHNAIFQHNVAASSTFNVNVADNVPNDDYFVSNMA